MSNHFTIFPDVREDHNGEALWGWLCVCTGDFDSISCFFPAIIVSCEDEDVEFDHGFESACIFGRRFLQEGEAGAWAFKRHFYCEGIEE